MISKITCGSDANIPVMDMLDEYFPYETYRPHQRRMLLAAETCAAEGGILMIDAPTGSGKSSVVAALLARAQGRKVLIAVRTISQLNTFVRELELIRKKRGELSFAYLIGKGNMCPMAGEGNAYRVCEGLKVFSTSLMHDRAAAGSLVPSQDPVVKQQMRRMSRDKPIICPYFIHSRVYYRSAEGLKQGPSARLRTKARQVSIRLVHPDQLWDVAENLCPYELMLQAARDSEVVIMNFHHLFDEGIRNQIYQSLGIEEGASLLLIDEAHNCGDTIQSIQSVALEERMVEQARSELFGLKNRIAGTEAILQLLLPLGRFMDSLKRSWKGEDWFDPHIFVRSVLHESLFGDIDEVVDDLLRISEAVRERNMKAGEFRETAIERLMQFFYGVLRATTDSAYLTVYRQNNGEIMLEVRNIDPAATMQDVAEAHACCILISGTLSPVESYRSLYFEDRPVFSLTLPNGFPEQNRRILCATDITSAFSMRKHPENIEKIHAYLRSFASLDGNLAVYFPSYEMLNAFCEELPARLNDKCVFIEPPSAQEASSALNQFLSLPSRGESGILFGVCGGKWSEGLDYRGELLGGAMVIGLPLAPFNPVRRMIIDYFRNKFGPQGEFISYTLPAINRALQALGRVLRTPEDRGVLLLGDSRFLEPGVRSGLPGWMDHEVIPCTITTFQEEIRTWR